MPRRRQQGRPGYGDPNRPTRESDYGKTGEYSPGYKKEFRPGATAKPRRQIGAKGTVSPLDDLLQAAARPARPKVFGAYRNVSEGKGSERKGQRFEVVHRNGVRYHKYASGKLVADKEAGSATKRVRPLAKPKAGLGEGLPAGMPGAVGGNVTRPAPAQTALRAGQQVGRMQSAAIDQALMRKKARRKGLRP